MIFTVFFIVIIILVVILVYITKIRIRDVAEFTNEENQYKIIFQAVGEPEFPFGKTRVKVTLVDSKNKKINSSI